MRNKFFLKPIKGTVIVHDDQPDTTVGGVHIGTPFGCRHLDFTVVAVNPEDNLDFGVGSVVILDDPNVNGDLNHRRMIDGIVYRAVDIEHIIAVKELGETNA